MRSLPVRLLFAVVLLSGSAVGVWHLAAAEPAAVANKPVTVSTSMAECKACHSGADQVGVRDFVNKFQSNQFLRLDESEIWEHHDPHSKAFAVLKDPKNAKLIERMSATLKYDVTTDSRCLTCHATDTHREQQRFDTSNGVGCAGCHGLQQDWQTEHYRSKSGTEIEWRTMDPHKKSTEYGLKNLRDPATKAAVCASCHVGNAAEGKVISHEMYSAGHPPLPPLELMAFLDDQPKHWKLPSELPYFTDAKNADKLKLFSVLPGDDIRARHFAIGAIASLQAEAKLLKHEAEEAMAKQSGLNYARFDCYACHHDLKLPSDRQKRGYPGAPGRPPLKAWNGALAGVVATFLGDDATFKKAWDDAQTAAYDQPYGNPKMLIESATVIDKWCTATIAKLNTPLLAKDTKAMLDTIATLLKDEKTLADPEAAMALLWAYKAMTGGDAAAWAKIKKELPVSPQDAADAKRGTPWTAGELGPDRMIRFNGFDATRFLKVQPLPGETK
ncbi:hypothetical protein BH11PLA2_BH11PLA2_11270 [soil metagenome]